MIDVEVNHKWQDNTTPLIWATDKDNLVMLLIDNGADVNQIDSSN